MIVHSNGGLKYFQMSNIIGQHTEQKLGMTLEIDILLFYSSIK